MKKAIVIGGGLAGLSAASHLIKNSVNVTIIESSPKLGGRAYSFITSKDRGYVDNGQHIMMGCYDDTIEFLKIINAEEEIEFQENLKIPFLDRENKFYLHARSSLYPFNLLKAILNYKALSLSERISVLRFFVWNIFYSAEGLQNVNVADWLRKNGQSENSIDVLWGILSVGTLNAPAEESSALLFRNVLRKIFFTGNRSTKIVFPTHSLSETFADKAGEYILKNGGEIRLSERVETLHFKGKRLSLIETNKNKYSHFDYVISSIPVKAFEKISHIPANPGIRLPALEYSPILSVHIWLKKNPFSERLYCILGSGMQWLFNNGTHITLLTSSAKELSEKGKNEIFEYFCLEIKKYFPFFELDNIKDSLVIKEKFATFIPSIESNVSRKGIVNPVSNLFLSGDWTDTELPATIESAIKSGKTAARMVCNS